VGPRAGLDAVVKRKIPSLCRDSNSRSSSPQRSVIPLSYPGSYLHQVQSKSLTNSTSNVEIQNEYNYPVNVLVKYNGFVAHLFQQTVQCIS
jgi:hypothetical protein